LKNNLPKYTDSYEKIKLPIFLAIHLNWSLLTIIIL